MYDVVICKEDMKNVPKGSLGVILEVYGNNDYEIEFVNEEGKTLNILTVNEQDVEAFNKESVKAQGCSQLTNRAP